MEAQSIKVGTIVTAKRATGVCDLGERGVCYEIYEIGRRPGYSFIFEKGRYDGFSPDDVKSVLCVSGRVAKNVANYRFTNVLQLEQDFWAGRFRAAFSNNLTEKARR